MNPKEFAIRTVKPEKTITAILKGESGITPDIAVLFESFLKISARFWFNTQQKYDEYIARENVNLFLQNKWKGQIPKNKTLKAML